MQEQERKEGDHEAYSGDQEGSQRPAGDGNKNVTKVARPAAAEGTPGPLSSRLANQYLLRAARCGTLSEACAARTAEPAGRCLLFPLDAVNAGGGAGGKVGASHRTVAGVPDRCGRAGAAAACLGPQPTAVYGAEPLQTSMSQPTTADVDESADGGNEADDAADAAAVAAAVGAFASVALGDGATYEADKAARAHRALR